MGHIADTLTALSDAVADEFMDLYMAKDEGEPLSQTDKIRLKSGMRLDELIDKASAIAHRLKI